MRAGTACSPPSQRSSCGSRRAGNCECPAADATCSRSPRASCSRSGSACAAATASRVPRLHSAPAAGGLAAGSLAVLNGSGAAPPNGALIITTDRNTSGRVSAHQPATGDPKSCPTTSATLRWPSALMSAIMSRTRLSVENGVEIIVELHVGAAAAAVAALIGRDHVIAGLAPAAASRAASCKRAREIRESAAPPGRSALSKPASSACIVMPLTPVTIRDRMPDGNRRRSVGDVSIVRGLRERAGRKRRGGERLQAAGGA